MTDNDYAAIGFLMTVGPILFLLASFWLYLIIRVATRPGDRVHRVRYDNDA